MPFLFSGSFGHLSAASAMPSLSLSGSGQPSSSLKPSLSSASVGQASTLSAMPSPSLSRGASVLGAGAGGAGGGDILPRPIDRPAMTSKSGDSPFFVVFGTPSTRPSRRSPMTGVSAYFTPAPAWNSASVSFLISSYAVPSVDTTDRPPMPASTNGTSRPCSALVGRFTIR